MSFQTMRLLIEIMLGLHFLFRCRAAFGGGWWQAPVLFWMALMLIPMLAQHRDLVPSLVTEVLLYIWPFWLGFLVFFALAGLALDLARLAGGLTGVMLGRNWWLALEAKRAVPLAMGLALALFIYAYYEAHHPRLVTLEIPTDKLPSGVDKLRIVQLSDIHLNRFVTRQELERIIELAAEARPDLLVVTGDLVDTDMHERADDAALLAAIKPRYGALAVFGNHEYYSGEENARRFYQRADLTLLHGEAVVAGGLIVAGVNDEAFGDQGNRQPAEKLLRAAQHDPRFVLLLKHRPNLAPNTRGLFDLQLSGHTHGGQIWPGHIFIKLMNGRLIGLFDEKPGHRSQTYISRGAGFWGLPLRFLAPPEVTVIELKRFSAARPAAPAQPGG